MSGKKKNSIKPYYGMIKELHEQGMNGVDIAFELGIDKNSVYNAVHTMGLSKKRGVVDESNLVYAECKKPTIEQVIVNGKIYYDITPLFSPR